MINIYPSNLDGAPLERHQIDRCETIHGWLTRNVPSYEVRAVPPISVAINGLTVPPIVWDMAVISPPDTVDIVVDPKGWEIIVAVISLVIAAASAIYSIVSAPSMPKTPSGATKGDTLDMVSAKGNKVKLNSIIREISGTFKVYPDYLLPAHVYFEDGTEQWIKMLLCVGKGSYSIPAETVLIGDTPFGSITEDAQYAIYEPGVDVSSDPGATWWHSAPEVAGTSTGKTGLELNATYALGEVAAVEAYSFSGAAITVPSGAGEWPNWADGTNLTIEQFLDYTVTDGGGDRDIITGNFASLAPFAGMIIEITGENDGNYVVNSFEEDSDGVGTMTLSFNNGGPVNCLLAGVRRMSIGYRQQRYQIIDIVSHGIPGYELRDELQVDRYTNAGVIDESWAGFATIITNDAIVAIDASDQEGDWAGPFAACPAGETTDTLEYDLMFPSGIGRVKTTGSISEVTVTTELQWREMGVGADWTVITKTTTAATLNQLGYTELVHLGTAIRAEVRMRRIGAKSTKTDIQDAVQWYGLKAKLTAPTSYSGVTTMSVTIRGGDRISAQSDQLISVVATRKLPTRSGGAWTAATATRSIVPWVAYIATSMGYTDADLSLADFDTLGAVWDDRGDYFDMAVESEGTVKGEMLNALRAGFAEFTLDRGVIKPVRDQVRTVYEHMYTPQNMTEQITRTFQTIRPDEYDGVDVEYIDGTTWAKETVECRLPGDVGGKTEKITIEGVTDRTRAWRIGMRQRRAQKYRRKSYKFSTELDALNSSYMSFCAVGDDVPGYSQSAILLSATAVSGAVHLQTSEEFTWTAGVAHVIGIRKPDGTLSGPYSATRISEKVVSIASIDFTPDTTWDVEPPHLIFGTLDRWSYPVLITSIAHNGESKVDVEAINYDVNVYTDDDNAPPT